MEYLINHINKIGWSVSNGMGLNSISWGEIHAYNQCHNYVLNESEMDIIKDMSSAFVRYMSDKDPNAIAPYGNNKKPSINPLVDALKNVARVIE